MASFYFHSLGCRLNQAEIEAMAQKLSLYGHSLTQQRQVADFVVLNSCTVTEEAEKKSIHFFKESKNQEHQKLVITGCHSQVDNEAFKHIDLIVSNDDKDQLIEKMVDYFNLEDTVLNENKESQALTYPMALGQSRAFVKIQDGCHLNCTFCLTTIARGDSRSRSVKDILHDVRSLVDGGCQEVVLTGVHAGAFKEGDKDLGWLIDHILSTTSLARLRLSSLEPWNLKDHWMELWQKYEGRLCPHIHMSLQSGSARILKKMKRIYTPELFTQKVQGLRKHISNLALTGDVIVGFPGETDEDFMDSKKLVQDLGFSDLHVFRFSPRPGTRAALLESEYVSESTKILRHKELQAISNRLRRQYFQSQVGKSLDVLWYKNKKDNNDEQVGLSQNYLKVKIKQRLSESTSQVRITAVEDNPSIQQVFLWAEPLTVA